MKQQFKGPISLDIAARTVTLHDIQLTPDRVLLVVNATVGYVYHNFSIDDPALITTVVRAPSTSTVWPNMAIGTDTVIHFADYKDCDKHQNTDAVSVFYEDGVDLGKLIKVESDETQALLQTEFDATQVQLTAFQVEVKAESDQTQTLLQAEFDQTQTDLAAFRAEVKAESDQTQTLLQTEFDQTQTAIAAFRAEVKAESDQTQTLLQTEFDQTQTDLAAFRAEVKSESDQTQMLLQTEFDQTQTDLAAFRAEVKAESDQTQTLLQTEFDQTQTDLAAFRAEIKAESDQTQTLLQTEFDDTQTILTAFKTEAKLESDETQTILNTKLPNLVSGRVPVVSTDNYSPMNGYSTAITNGPYGPTKVTYTKSGTVAVVVNLTYDTSGKLISVV